MNKIFVTKSFLPPLEVYEFYLKKIWKTAFLTNQGPLLKEFESKLKKYLEIENFHFVTNGTLALQLAIRALEISDGEIITTPFSYVATTSAILWEKYKPVFVDIKADTFNIDADKIEAAVTKKTKAILAVHVFGIPCEVEKIAKIAKKHHLKVIYDGAHAFGVKYKGKSLLSYGDISICSFHATKLFHTIEGGCIITKDKKINDKLDLMKRFGHYGDDHHILGINAKASEFQAAMGLCNLKYLKKIVDARKIVVGWYDELLEDRFQKLIVQEYTKHNYSYYSIVFKSEVENLKAIEALEKKNIFPRRYFYPSLNKLPYLEESMSCPVSETIAGRILSLPLYVGLEKKIVEKVCRILKK